MRENDRVLLQRRDAPDHLPEEARLLLPITLELDAGAQLVACRKCHRQQHHAYLQPAPQRDQHHHADPEKCHPQDEGQGKSVIREGQPDRDLCQPEGHPAQQQGNQPQPKRG